MKIQHHLRETDFEDRFFHHQSFPQCVYPRFTLFLQQTIPLFPFASSILFHLFIDSMSSPCHIVSCYTSSPCVAPMVFCSSVPCSVLLIVLLTLSASFLAHFPEETLPPPCLPLSCILIFLPSCLRGSCFQTMARSSVSCLVLAKGRGQSLDREVPFSAQSPVQAWPICLDQQVKQGTCQDAHGNPHINSSYCLYTDCNCI